MCDSLYSNLEAREVFDELVRVVRSIAIAQETK
jgi:hypothetical protein